jgi:pimeloyl-ACP methyl ester carboxylesterase
MTGLNPAPTAVPTWVLLRGLTRDSRHWGSFPTTLANALQTVQPGARVVTLDLPGNGARHHERSPAHVDAMAEDCRTELRRLGHAPPYHVLAMSLGAMVALSWAQRHPAELTDGVLINTSVRPHSPAWRRLRPSACLRLLGRALADAWPARRDTAASDMAWERCILQLTSEAWRSGDAASQALLTRWAAWRQQCPVSRSNAWRQLLAAARYRADERAGTDRPATRWLLLAGAGDRLVHPGCSAALARARQLPLAVHPTAGHDLPLDDPAWVAGQVRAWLSAWVA